MITSLFRIPPQYSIAQHMLTHSDNTLLVHNNHRTLPLNILRALLSTRTSGTTYLQNNQCSSRCQHTHLNSQYTHSDFPSTSTCVSSPITRILLLPYSLHLHSRHIHTPPSYCNNLTIVSQQPQPHIIITSIPRHHTLNTYLTSH